MAWCKAMPCRQISSPGEAVNKSYFKTSHTARNTLANPCFPQWCVPSYQIAAGVEDGSREKLNPFVVPLSHVLWLSSVLS